MRDANWLGLTSLQSGQRRRVGRRHACLEYLWRSLSWCVRSSLDTPTCCGLSVSTHRRGTCPVAKAASMSVATVVMKTRSRSSVRRNMSNTVGRCLPFQGKKVGRNPCSGTHGSRDKVLMSLTRSSVLLKSWLIRRRVMPIPMSPASSSSGTE